MYKERIAHYEAIERELDDAIIAAAESTGGEENQDVLNVMGHAPTASKRRIQQSLALASRLQAKQKELDRLIGENRSLQSKIRDYESDA